LETEPSSAESAKVGLGAVSEIDTLSPMLYAAGQVTAIGCLLYNLIAKFTGGIEVSVGDVPN